MTPRTVGICSLCSKIIEFTPWPSDLPAQGHRGVYFDPSVVCRMVAEENEGRIREHLMTHTARVMLAD